MTAAQFDNRGNDHRTNALRIIRGLLRPIIRLCLRRSIYFNETLELLKRAFVEVAEEELKQTTEKVNVSRISVLTGLYRTEVTRIYRTLDQNQIEEPLSLIGRVIELWSSSKRFANKAGEPRVLDCDGPGSEFFQLVEEISKDTNPGTVLFELERNGAAIRGPRGLKLVRATVALGVDEVAGYELLADDIDTLFKTVEHNLNHQDQVGNAHMRTEYLNVYQKHIPKIRKWLIDLNRRYHKEIRDFVSKFDKTLNPTSERDQSAGASVVAGSFSLIENAGDE